jgi:hypothetical protein
MFDAHESFALCDAVERRCRLGEPRAFAPSLEGQVVTLAGVIAAAVELVAETHVAASGVLGKHRCFATIALRAGPQSVVLEGVLAVVVGSHERERVVAPRGLVSFRELRSGATVRARGRLRRTSSPRPIGYRDDATAWALFPTGSGDAIDVASEAAPIMIETAGFWGILAEKLPVDDGEPPVSRPAEVLSELLRRRRSRG